MGVLFVRIDVDVALDAFLTVICPRVAGHPLPFALWALVLPEAALLALVRCLALGLWASLRTISYVVALFEAQMTEIVGRWNFAVLLILLPVHRKHRMLLMVVLLQMVMLMAHRSTAIRIARAAISKQTIQTISLEGAIGSRSKSISTFIAGEAIQTV